MEVKRSRMQCSASYYVKDRYIIDLDLWNRKVSSTLAGTALHLGQRKILARLLRSPTTHSEKGKVREKFTIHHKRYQTYAVVWIECGGPAALHGIDARDKRRIRHVHARSRSGKLCDLRVRRHMT